MIWNGFDFDFSYALDLFKHQLKRQADFMESDHANTMCAKINASKIRTAIKLIDKVYDSEYGGEYQDKMRKLYGENVLDFVFTDCVDNDKYSTLNSEFESWENADEVEEMHTKLFKESQEKQERAHKLLWNYIEHNIQRWWD